MNLRAFLWTVVFGTVAVALVFFFAAPRVRADEMSDRAAWFKELTVPGSTDKCCDVSDGFPAEARMIDGTWFARLVPGGRYPIPEGFGDRWIPVPPEIVLKTPSIDERAVLFIWQGTLRCFVPPLQGF